VETAVGVAGPICAPAPGGEEALDIVMVQPGEADLLEVVFAFEHAGRFARRLNGGKQQRNQDAHHRDDDKQFDERESWAAGRVGDRGETRAALRSDKAHGEINCGMVWGALQEKWLM